MLGFFSKKLLGQKEPNKQKKGLDQWVLSRRTGVLQPLHTEDHQLWWMKLFPDAEVFFLLQLSTFGTGDYLLCESWVLLQIESIVGCSGSQPVQKTFLLSSLRIHPVV